MKSVETAGEDIETNGKGVSENARERGERKVVVVHGVNRPLFHVDLTVAMQSAIHNAERREGASAKLLVEDVADFQEH